ncbi:MAG: hypothetical protein KDA57_17785 [Planctomycetales bacterium]|nr:hypothetical protein [Planctomycetales bacterium]
MASVVSSQSDYDTISVKEAKRQLRIASEDFDKEVEDAIREAIDYCERITGRTLRTAVGRTDKHPNWCEAVKGFQWQPVIGVSAVSYYDADGNSQSVSSSYWRFLTSTNGPAKLEFDADYTLPVLDVRSDAVQVTYTTGYADIDDVPPAAKRAIKTMLTVFWGDLAPQAIAKWEQSAIDTLRLLEWGAF